MQTLIQVVCSGSGSLRDAVANDEKLEKFNLYVEEKRKPGRSPGWTKLHSLNPTTKGAINLHWQGDVKILTCRVVTRGRGKPAPIIGDFVRYLLSRYSRRVESIIVVPR